MKLNIKRFAAYAALAMGIAYVICAIVVFSAPEIATTLMNWLFHTLTIEKRTMTPVGFIGGLVQIVIYTYIISATVAWAFNKSIGEKQAAVEK